MIASPLRPRLRQESGIAAACRLAHRGTPYGASLSFATTTHLWPLPDPPSRKPADTNSRQQTARPIPGRALASSVMDSPCQGSRSGLTPPISTSVPSTLASLGPVGPPLTAGPLRLDGNEGPLTRTSSSPTNREEHECNEQIKHASSTTTATRRHPRKTNGSQRHRNDPSAAPGLPGGKTGQSE